MGWTVVIQKRARKQIQDLPQPVYDTLFLLVTDIQQSGPVQGQWPNYSKLSDNRHHCHIKKGKPCYVVVWQVTDKKIKLIEVQYAGTHEKAPY